MLSFPNAKINIGLQITGKRPDGYHNLETVFYPVNIRDALETVPADALLFTSSGIPIPGEPGNNLCLKAVHLLRREFEIPPVHIHLHKEIPMGAGIGGGSADAGFLIRQLNAQFELGMSTARMEAIAAKLGADCPFFIRNTPVFATGRGDEFEPIDLDLSSFYIVLVMPPVHVSTAEAFRGVVARGTGASLKEMATNPPSTWKNTISNDFEEGVMRRFPVISAIKQQLYAAGAQYAAMSGSGAAVYAIFAGPVRLPGIEGIAQVFYGI